MNLPEDAIARVAQDFGRAELGDPRRTRRAQLIATRLARQPSVPFPEALKDDAQIEGAYRFARNKRVTMPALLRAHSSGTVERAEQAQSVWVLHDTTSATFPSLDPKDIGYLPTGKPGFLFHVSLVLDASQWRLPLGVVSGETIHRAQRSKRKGKKKRSGRETAADAAGEGARWWRGIEAAGHALSGCAEVIHVADRESDSYDLMNRCLEAGGRFVFRVRVADRRARNAEEDASEWSSVKRIAENCQGVLEREVELSPRTEKSAPGMNRGNPPRAKRTATLRFSAACVELPRPQYLQDPTPKTLTVNLVHVIEVDAPKGQAPVEWLLYTTEPIETPEQVARIVDIYRARWTIEEFNAALKTGCAYESRQFESRHALLNILALSLPVACEALALRSRARDCPDAPATDVLRPAQIEVLRRFGRRKLGASPTARQALLAVAGLGGHMKHNGEPGWNILMRGMRTLLAYETAWVAGRESVSARRRSRELPGGDDL
jgi:hypothetical protein